MHIPWWPSLHWSLWGVVFVSLMTWLWWGMMCWRWIGRALPAWDPPEEFPTEPETDTEFEDYYQWTDAGLPDHESAQEESTMPHLPVLTELIGFFTALLALWGAAKRMG
jgi:hypothetical protein